MDGILTEEDIKAFKTLSKTENKCFIKNPINKYDYAVNGYMYLNSNGSQKRFNIEWRNKKKLGIESLTQFAKTVVAEALEKFKKSSKKQQTLDHIFATAPQKKKIRIMYLKC